MFVDTYFRGVNLLASRAVNDDRFKRLSTALSDAKLTIGNGRMDRKPLEVPKTPPKRRSQFLPDLDDLQSASRHRKTPLIRATTTYM